MDVPNEPEVQLQNLGGTVSINNKSNCSPSPPLPYHTVDVRSDTPPNKKRKVRENSNANSEKNAKESSEAKSSEAQKSATDPVEIIPLMPNLKLEMPEYLEQDGSSCSYEEQNLGESSSRSRVDGNSSETTDEHKPDISQTFYSPSQTSSEALDPSKSDAGKAGKSSKPCANAYQSRALSFPGHMLSKPSTSSERTQESAQGESL